MRLLKRLQKGWKKHRPEDQITLQPVSDGGDGFGVIMAEMIRARKTSVKTVNAALQTITASYWWEPRSKLAIIEAANIVGLAMLPTDKFHPFHLNTFGLGTALLAASEKGARKALIGVGGECDKRRGIRDGKSLGLDFLRPTGARDH